MNLLVQLGWTPEWESRFQDLGDAGLEPARVLAERKRLYTIGGARGETLAVLAGRLQHETAGTADRPAVGDWVAVEAAADRARIRAVLPRQSALVRKVAFRRTLPQVVAANVDTVLIVASLDRDFSPRRLERYLAFAWESGARPVVLLNKADLCADVPLAVGEAEGVAPGVPVHAVSASTGAGRAGLAPYLGRAETAVLVGSSGVGKSTLVNLLLGAEVQAVQDVRARDGRGQHTTSSRELLRLPGGGLLIDTPGLRELVPWESEEGVGAAFRDIETLARRCRFRDCAHAREPGCAVRRALDDGSLDADRYASWVKLSREQAWLARRQDEHALLEEKRRWKRIHRAMRKHPKRPG